MTAAAQTAEKARPNPHALRFLIRDLSGEDVGSCIQCGKCTAGCLVAPDVPWTPNQIMQLIRLNDTEALLAANTYWFCTSCQTCSTRCPVGIDIAKVMNTLRLLVLDRELDPAEHDVATVNKVFLRSLRAHGRVFELGVVMNKNFRTYNPFRDASLGPAMFSKGKIGIKPHNIKNRKRIRKILREAERFNCQD